MSKQAIRALSLVVFVVVGVLLVLWSSQRGERPEASSGVAGGAARTAASDVRELRLGLNIAAGSALHAAAVRFAEQVAEQSKGRLKVTVFPDQQLGSDDQMLEMARSGKLDLVLTPTAKLSSAIPAMQYADLPFYFTGREELYTMLDGEPGRMLLSKLNAIDLVGLAFWENGFKQFTANTPIRRPQDFAKMRIRTMKSRIIADQFEVLGAQAIPIDFHATYKALADGAVDGEENPLVAIVGMRFHEVQKHLTVSNHAYLAYVFSISKAVFESLSPELREVIRRSAQELTVWERQETFRREAQFIDTVRAAGVEIHTLTSDEREAFRKALAPIADKFGFEVGYDLLVKTEELRYQREEVAQAANPGRRPAALVLGVDADFSMRSAQGGGAIYRGVQLAAEEINADGGVRGVPLRVIGLDHATSSLVGRKNLERFAAMPSLLGVVGGVQTAVIADELEDIHRLKIPFMIPWGTGRGLVEHGYRPNYTFRVSISDTLAAPFLLERALRGGGRVVVLLERSAWGRSNDEVLKPVIERLPAGRVEIEWFNVGDAGTEAKLRAICDGNAAAIVLVANAVESQKIVQMLARQDKPLPVFAHAGLTSGNFWQTTQGALQRVDLRFVQSILMDDAATHPRFRKFLQRYRERFGLGRDEMVPSLIATVHAYELTHMLARAARQVRPDDHVAVRGALEALGAYPGVLRDYNPPFTSDRHDALERGQLRLARFDARGRIVVAE
ncbi:DctP family TRAP transporter solute-binding subunit [Zoogloea sp.]|uniref:DctP family TRAP transporter solute-binding subunit n=1 Tax=Zoogloea sp. TaxID=49181 RepID=UPI0035B11D20